MNIRMGFGCKSSVITLRNFICIQREVPLCHQSFSLRCHPTRRFSFLKKLFPTVALFDSNRNDLTVAGEASCPITWLLPRAVPGF